MKWERWFPVLASIRSYSAEDFRGDITAGLTTAVMLVPQGMAYAMLAGLPPIVGLYASLVPGAVYALLGTSRQLSVGPVAMDSLLVAAGVGALAKAGSEDYVALAVMLGLMTGAIQLILGLLRAGFLVNFLSHPVISGFTSAAALIIAASQLKHLFGVPLDANAGIFAILGEAAGRIHEVSVPTLVVGAIAIVGLLLLKRHAPKAPRALLAVIVGTLAVKLLDLDGPVAVVGDIPAGLPRLSLPTATTEHLSQLFPTALAIALVAFMESISVSKAYARKNRYPVEPSRELIALGVANIVGGLFQGYPVTGGFSRTAVNATAGARTNVAAWITSAGVGLTLLFLTPALYSLPKAVLSAIIVTAVFGLVDVGEVLHLYKVKKSDLVLLGLTFFTTLAVGIVKGIGVGVLASLAWFVIRTTRPHIAVLGRVPGTRLYRNVLRQPGLLTYPGLLVIRMDAQFYFGNITFLKDTLAELEARAEDPLRAVVLDASAMNNLDSSAETALREIYEEYEARGIPLYLSTVKGPVRDVLDRSGFSQRIGRHADFRAVQDAVDAALLELEGLGRDGPSVPLGRGSSGPRSTAKDGPAARPESLDSPNVYVI